jgi:hypothetical protein
MPDTVTLTCAHCGVSFERPKRWTSNKTGLTCCYSEACKRARWAASRAKLRAKAKVEG